MKRSSSGRQIKPPDYYRLFDLCGSKQVPRRSRKREQHTDNLYPVTVLENNGSRCKVHYIGYSDSHDEWKDYDDLESLNLSDDYSVAPFSLYRELASRIKTSLNSGRKESPVVRIEMPFDRITLDGGLGLYGVRQSIV